MTDGTAPTAPNEWRAIIARYQQSSRARSIAQIATTLVPLAPCSI